MTNLFPDKKEFFPPLSASPTRGSFSRDMATSRQSVYSEVNWDDVKSEASSVSSATTEAPQE